MSTYLYCGKTLQSNIPIAELPLSDAVNLELRFTLGRASEQLLDYPWMHRWYDSNNEAVLSYFSQKFDHWLHCPGLADFRISAIADDITCFPLSKIPENTIRHLLLDQILPRCLAHQGRIMLHASAVRFGPSLILFLGDSGTGKSTLAGNFHQLGSPVLSDDCVWIREEADQINAIPSYGGLRLWEDSLGVLFSSEQESRSMAHYSTKRRVPLPDGELLGSGNGIPILALIVLAPSARLSTSDILIERLSQREAFIAVMRQTFQLDLSDLKRMSGHMHALGRIIPRLLAYRLSIPHNYDLLPAVRQKILEAVL